MPNSDELITLDYAQKLVLFIYDVFYFAKRWKPFTVHFNSPKFLWNIARRRRVVKAAIQKKKQKN
ncbi:MAG: hypothetical protein K9M45_05470 [Kiritimatiellales bacterium]|nr:hypothetical protein [Kiritimatiellales bacterium]